MRCPVEAVGRSFLLQRYKSITARLVQPPFVGAGIGGVSYPNYKTLVDSLVSDRQQGQFSLRSRSISALR